MTDAENFRKQKATSTDPERLEREAKMVEQMTDTMFERMAKAAAMQRKEDDATSGMPVMGQIYDPPLPMDYRMVRAILQAALVPNEAMVAAFQHGERACTGPRDWVIAQAWPFAIDVILKEAE